MSDTIKDFVKKQTATLNIATPKERPAAPQNEPVQETIEPEAEQGRAEHKTGRPRSTVEKTKISIYTFPEVREKLVRIQHENYRQSMNDVINEAITDLLKKYGK